MKLKSLVLGAMALTAATANAACPTFADSLGTQDGKEVCGLNDKAPYSGDLLLTSDKLWVLQGGVFIGGDNKDRGVLTIQPGTTITGKSGADFLVVSRGSQIMAEGTKAAPIVFTTGNKGNTARGQWGGLVINGNAPINTCGTYSDAAPCEATGEGSTGVYGGNDKADNSGVLKYVRVEFAGFEITPDNELNGIAFQGVGNGTVVDYIQVHKNSDDGVEFFGGTVDVKHVLLTGNRDDSMDWTSGWRGRAQFVIIDQFEDAANNTIEADNRKSPMDAAPISNPVLSNFTILGTKGAEAKGGSALFRVGTGVDMQNSIITGGKKGCIDIDDESTYTQGNIQFIGNFLNCSVNFEAEAGETWSVADLFTIDNFNETNTDPMLLGYAPMAASPVVNLGDVTPFGDARYGTFFDAVDYAGAVKDANDTWYAGWANLARD